MARIIRIMVMLRSKLTNMRMTLPHMVVTIMSLITMA